MLPNYQARSPFVLKHTTSLYICLDVCMLFCTLTLGIFVFALRSTPSQTSLNRILRFSNHYPYHSPFVLKHTASYVAKAFRVVTEILLSRKIWYPRLPIFQEMLVSHRKFGYPHGRPERKRWRHW